MEPKPAESPHSTEKEAGRAGFLAEYWLRLLAISAAVIAPCLWHEHIEAGDLPSHVYNAWLAHLIRTGQAPGLYIARQWNNILFDVSLEWVARVVGLPAAERIVTSLAVLIFFWGAFAVVCAMARRASRKNVPWFVLPALAMFAYGYTFEMGFMNYYVSIGLAFFALALVLRATRIANQDGSPWNWLGVLLLTPLIWLAHPLGMVLLIGGGAYILLADRLPPRLQVLLFAASALLILAVRIYIAGHYVIAWRAGPRLVEDGTDQLLIYGPHYRLPAYALQFFFWGALLWDAITRLSAASGGVPETHEDTGEAAAAGADNQPRWWSVYLLPLQLYGLALLAAWLLPSVVRVPQYAAPVGLLTERLTSVSAVLICCLLGVMRPRKSHLAGLAAIAAVFFFFLYQDTGALNRMEDQAAHYVRLIPPGQRVLETIFRFPGSRIFIDHMVDRACIQQCFSYENYEPSSLQFRVRVRSENPMVMSSAENADAAQGGTYILQPKDLPAFQIYQCDLTMTRLCMRELAVGEENGRVGLHFRNAR